MVCKVLAGLFLLALLTACRQAEPPLQIGFVAGLTAGSPASALPAMMARCSRSKNTIAPAVSRAAG